MTADEAPSVSTYIAKFQKAKRKARDFLEPIDERTFRRKPSSDKWCIGECFSHLVETGNTYFHQVEKGISNASPANGREKVSNPMHLRFHMKWFVNYLAPPISFKTKSPGSFHPREYVSIEKDTIIKDYLELQDRFIDRLEYVERKHINPSKLKVSNPLIPWISMTVAECIAATEAHQRRHLEQARYTLTLVSDTASNA